VGAQSELVRGELMMGLRKNELIPVRSHWIIHCSSGGRVRSIEMSVYK
jgi:hypothetical protein